MRYLFVDIEWINMEKENHIISLAALIMKNENFVSRKYNSTFCPKILNSLVDKDLKMFHTKLAKLKESKTFKEWMRGNWNELLKSDFWVFWDRNSYDAFMGNCFELGLFVDNMKVILLQELLATVSVDCDNNIGFKKYMEAYGCWFDARARHNSYYDVACLQNLFWKSKKYVESINLDINNQSYLLNTASNVLHIDTCKYVRRIKEGNRLKLEYHFGNSTGVFCKMCMKEHIGKRVFKIKDFIDMCKNSLGVNEVMQEACLDNICNALGIEYELNQDVIEIITRKATWKIYHYKNKILNLFHENCYIGDKRQKRKMRKGLSLGFHCQNMKFNSIRDACLYIYMHDYGARNLSKLCVY